MSWFIAKIKLQIDLRILGHLFLRITRGVEQVVKGPLADSISRIYVPAPYLAVADTALDVLVVYPIYVSDTLLVACSSPLPHLLVSAVVYRDGCQRSPWR